MATAVGAAALLLGKVLTKLSDDLVASYVASSELGLDSEQISRDLKLTHGLLRQAQGRDIGHGPAVNRLLEELRAKAGRAEDALNELQYFMIQEDQDQLGTQLVKPDLGGGPKVNKGSWLPCFSCSCTSSPQHGTKSDGDGHVEKLAFDSVSISIRIKSLIQEVHSICIHVSDLFRVPNHSTISAYTPTTVTPKRPLVSSTAAHDILYGRAAIFEETIGVITSCRIALSVVVVCGPGGIGKTTFVQHLYNDARTAQHFDIRIWLSASQNFNEFKLTQQILRQIPATEEEEGSASAANEITNVDQLQLSIARRLQSKRFLLVLDDMWTWKIEAELKNLLALFTNVKVEGSVVLVTTRLLETAQTMNAGYQVELEGLDTEDFLTFFEACIFGDLDKPEHYRDELTDIARNIAIELNGSPLAAKTVRRLLRNDLSVQHWMRVLENKEWEAQVNNNDIMSALYISYDYLPFLLQKCFSYCSLFPKDYEFSNSELNRFWIAVGIIDPSQLGNHNYLEELVDRGFFKKMDALTGDYYVRHDLLHDLSSRVSAQECLNIGVSHFQAGTVRASIRHLSVTLENSYDEHFQEKVGRLKRWIDIPNLRTLMIFAEYEESIAKILKDTFNEVNNLHCLFIVVNLKKLTLVWSSKQPTADADILDALQPHPNLRELRITNYGGAVCPSWFCIDILLENLEALHLEGVTWDTLPPFGQLPHLTRLILTRISGVHQLEIQDMASLESLMICRCSNIFS